jgi:hypothetical protein
MMNFSELHEAIDTALWFQEQYHKKRARELAKPKNYWRYGWARKRARSLQHNQTEAARMEAVRTELKAFADYWVEFFQTGDKPE